MRVRRDRVDPNGTVTLRHRTRLHHIGGCGPLKPRPGWKAPICIAERVTALLDTLEVAERDVWEAEVRGGEDIFQLLVCSAAVATQLDAALGLEEQSLAA